MILENIKLSKEEYEFLQKLKNDYKWIARDSTGNLCAYEDKPYKSIDVWISGAFCTLNSCNHMFSFIQWTDNVPTLISDIIEKCQIESKENKLGTNTMTDFEAIKVSRGERIVLQMLDKKYKWIARDKNGTLYVFGEKPEKGCICWFYCDEFYSLSAFNHHFKFIQWSDEEPWLITDIINKCGTKFE